MTPDLTKALLPDVLKARAELSGEKPFLHAVGGAVVSYRLTYARACSIANGLIALSSERNECILIMAANGVESVLSWLGIALAGATEVAINTGYRGKPLEHVMQNSQARLMFIEAAYIPRLLEIRESLTHLQTLIV